MISRGLIVSRKGYTITRETKRDTPGTRPDITPNTQPIKKDVNNYNVFTSM